MLIGHYLNLLHRSEDALESAFLEVAAAHADEPDVAVLCRKLAGDAGRHAQALRPFAERYGENAEDEPDRLHRALFDGTREGPLGLLRDLHDLYLLATECDVTWTMLGQAAQGLRDHGLVEVVRSCDHETALAVKWLKTRMKSAAPQTLVVA